MSNISEGLKYECALFPNFFKYTNSMFDIKINIAKLFSANVLEIDNEPYLLGEGLETIMDTTPLLNTIEFENYSNEE